MSKVVFTVMAEILSDRLSSDVLGCVVGSDICMLSRTLKGLRDHSRSTGGERREDGQTALFELAGGSASEIQKNN
nr:hypothetical protein [Roseovarius sp. W115]MDV2930992.1 hypothetical protein [Roseovarius sp. W115]